MDYEDSLLHAGSRIEFQFTAILMSSERSFFRPAMPMVFATTRWTLVLAAGGNASGNPAAALEELCRIYYGPVLGYVRRSGYGPEDAEDMTQEFFSRLLARRDLNRVDRDKGRFRNFLLVSVRHFLADAADKARAQKRGGGAVHVPLDATTGPDRIPVDPPAPGKLEDEFDRTWANTLLDRAKDRLREECLEANRIELFDALGPEASMDSEEDYSSIGARLGLSVAGVKSAAFRLRRRYREIIREEVAGTVAEEKEIEWELRELLRVVAGGNAG